MGDRCMKIYEFGRENADKLVLLHPSLVTWDYFEKVHSKYRFQVL